MYKKHSSHPAIKYEIIGIISDALEQMDNEEIIAFDKWFFSEKFRKNLNKHESKVVKIIDIILE